MADDLEDARRAPGWKRDPWQRFAGRYWDGETWTEHVITAAKVRATDPVPPPPEELAEPDPTAVMDRTSVMPAAAPSARRVWDGFRRWPRWAQWMAGVFGVLLLVGVAGASEQDNKAKPGAGDIQTTLTLPEAVTTTAAPTTIASTSTLPASTTLAPTTTAVSTTRPPVASTVAPTTSSPATSPSTTRAPAVHQGVTPGAFCSPGGALGVTSTGVDMVCTTTATDDRNRWRRA